MERVNSNNLVIANGRKVGDSNGVLTCITENGSSVVDYCITSVELYEHLLNFSVKDFTHISDHCPISCVLKCDVDLILKQYECKKLKNVYKYIWDDESKLRFSELVNSDHVQKVFEDYLSIDHNDTNAISKSFEDILIYIADKSLKKVKCKRKRKSTFEFSNECRVLKKDFHNQSNEYKREFTNNDKRIKMLIARNKYRKAISKQKKQIKEKHINNLEGLDKKDPKQFWQSIKDLLNTGNDTKVDITNDQWVDYFRKLLNKDQKVQSQFSTYVDSSLEFIEQKSMFNENCELNKQIEVDEILNSIKVLKNNKSPGIDCITNDMLKSNAKSLLKPIRKLFNVILNNGEYPENWNCALITPIFKSGSKDDPQNYRGIAVANSLSKIFLKIITNRIDSHMKSNEFWSDKQNGFKKNVRTEDNLFILKTAIHEMNVVNNKPLFACFVDFSKFFDTINRNMLLYKLQKYNITGNVYNFVKSMYKNCVYAIKHNNFISELFNSCIGVKQGCPLSPVISNIFQNDLHEIFNDSCGPIQMGSRKLNSLSWADDLVLLSTSQKGLQKCLDNLMDYCKQWSLTVNVSKTKCMVFGKGKIKNLKYDNAKVEQVDSYNYIIT